jgi:hypothetical protein
MRLMATDNINWSVGHFAGAALGGGCRNTVSNNFGGAIKSGLRSLDLPSMPRSWPDE